MSGKLLHERLREYAASEEKNFMCGTTLILGLWGDEANALADEIERQYVPVPRFPDGTRVEMGCKVEGGIVECWCVWDDGSFDLYNDEGDTIHEGKPGDFAKTPEPDSLEKLRDYVEECRPPRRFYGAVALWCDFAYNRSREKASYGTGIHGGHDRAQAPPVRRAQRDVHQRDREGDRVAEEHREEGHERPHGRLSGHVGAPRARRRVQHRRDSGAYRWRVARSWTSRRSTRS